jgi:hypothetical protein
LHFRLGFIAYDRTFDFIIENGDLDILLFWSGTTKFKVLKNVASWVLAIPASSASDERVFSTTGGTLSPRRTELGGSTIADLTYINKNNEFFEQKL